MSTTVKLAKHFPVLLNELKSIISPLYSGTFIDCTFGQGGYSKEILKNKNNIVLAIDRDLETKSFAKILEDKFGKRFKFRNLKFSKIDNLQFQRDNLKAIIFDLGYSLGQVKDLSRGISFNSNTKLNMKMGLNKFSADEVINKMSEKSLNKILKYFGEESKSKIISRTIIRKRKNKNLNTQDLVSIINTIYKGKKRKIHNATKTFQSLRIFVNKEISELIFGLINSFKILPVGGVIIVITFNSIEDRIVKFFFKNYSELSSVSRYLPKSKNNDLIFELVNKKPIYPTNSEIKVNPPSRGAKLRYAIKKRNSHNFDDFIKKFENFLNIEKLDKEIWENLLSLFWYLY